MCKRIKLENIIPVQKSHGHAHDRLGNFCPECGENLMKENLVEEYVCATCRHLISPTDKFCIFCGVSIDGEGDIEHYAGGRKLTHEEFILREVR